MVKPDEGRINYEKFEGKQASRFVDKVINGKVEKIEMIEEISPQLKATSNSKSLVKISKEHCSRAAMVCVSFFLMRVFV